MPTYDEAQVERFRDAIERLLSAPRWADEYEDLSVGHERRADGWLVEVALNRISPELLTEMYKAVPRDAIALNVDPHARGWLPESGDPGPYV